MLVCFLSKGSLVLEVDLLALDERIGNQLFGIEVFLIHINGGNLRILVGRVVVNAARRVAAGGVNRDLVLSVRHLAAAALLIDRAQYVEELTHALRFRFARDGIHPDERRAHKAGH